MTAPRSKPVQETEPGAEQSVTPRDLLVMASEVETLSKAVQGEEEKDGMITNAILDFARILVDRAGWLVDKLSDYQFEVDCSARTKPVADHGQAAKHISMDEVRR